MPLRILHYSDLEDAYDDPARIGRLAGLIRSLRDEETVVCGSGDNLAPGVLSLVTEGRQSLDFFRAVEPDVDTFGNHDFDHGFDALRSVVAASPQTWLAGNVHLDGERFAADEGTVPWTVVEAGSHRVGVVGVAHPETPTMNPKAEAVTFTDPVEAAAEGTAALRDRGVDRVVVVSHVGDDEPIARAVDADMVLGGHVHDPRNEVVAGTLLTRPGASGTGLTEVTFDGGRPTATRHEVPAGTALSAADDPASEPSDDPFDESVAAALRERMADAGLTEEVATAAEPVVCDRMATNRGESRLGNLVTDAMRRATDADVALVSAAGIRTGPPLSGAVTAFDLYGLVPFDDELAVLELDGETLLAAFHNVALDHYDDVREWFFGHVAGAELVWDDDAGALRAARVAGDPVDPDATYAVATSDYYVESDHLFPAFDAADVVERRGPLQEAIVAYARAEGVAPEREGRIRRPTLDESAVPEWDGPFSP